MIECSRHGRIHGRKDAKYCPICGKEVIAISMFPLLKLYIWKGDLFKAAIVIAVMVVSIVAIVHRDRSDGFFRDSRKQAMVRQMSPEWQFIYNSMDKLSPHERDSFLTQYLREDSQRLGMAKLGPRQVDLFLDLALPHQRSGMILRLKPFLRLDEPGPEDVAIQAATPPSRTPAQKMGQPY